MLVPWRVYTDSFSSGGLLLQSWLPGLFAVTPVLGSWDDVGVSKNRGTPIWMVYNGKPYSS